ncbi:hypothetical protein J6590_040532 [Homalodisca vitripennis]|nr:hypothetical protein J6590_040532 [Homalodisca vitripennis]
MWEGLILTEHGFSSETLLLIKVNGYNLIADFSREQHKLGGVAIYIAETSDINVEILDIENHCRELLCEAAMVRIGTKQYSFNLIGLYRSPGENTRQAIEGISEIISTHQSDVRQTVVMGDVSFNRLTANHDNILFEEELQYQHFASGSSPFQLQE